MAKPASTQSESDGELHMLAGVLALVCVALLATAALV